MLKRYLFLSIILLSVLLFSKSSYAASAWGTHMPEKKQWLWGLEESFLMDRDLDNSEGGLDGNRYFLTGSYGIFPCLSFDGKIGAGDIDWESRKDGADLSYSTGFAGGYGFRVRGYENEEWGIRNVVGFQHISIHPEAKNQEGNKHEAVMDEWQASIVVSKDVENFVPYLGVRYGTYDFIKWLNEHDRKRIKSEENFGIILGMDYWWNDRIKLYLEGAFLDGEEIAFGVSWEY